MNRELIHLIGWIGMFAVGVFIGVLAGPRTIEIPPRPGCDILIYKYGQEILCEVIK